MKKVWRALAACTAALAFSVCASVGVAGGFTSDSYRITPGMSLSWRGGLLTALPETEGGRAADVSVQDTGKSFQAELTLFHAVPVKTVTVSVVPQRRVIPCGTPFGIKMFTNGVMVVGTADIQTAEGMVNPARLAGVQMGDIITSVNGQTVNRNEEIAALVEQSGGQTVSLCFSRQGEQHETKLQPVRSLVDGAWKAGVWVRDSTAGIGTLTYYDPETGSFGGLGHGVCDTDTSELMPFLTGEILPVTINGVTKGKKGVPGELHGYFAGDEAVGAMWANDEAGVYGTLYESPAGTAVPVALRQEVRPGRASILATVDDAGPQYYEVMIEQVDYRDETEGKNMVLHVVDQKLLDATGGIVQGLSGSPILQNGKLVGAVTHVFVNDPTRGYGIFAESMLAAGGEAAETAA